MSKLDPTMVDWTAFGTNSVCAVGDLLKKIDPTMRDRSKVDPTMKSNRTKLDPTNTKLWKKIF